MKAKPYYLGQPKVPQKKTFGPMVGACHLMFGVLMPMWCHLFLTLRITIDTRQRANMGMTIDQNITQRPYYFTDKSN
jgi:hypothetical protein